jgi:preprotein translocase subunit SecE
VSINEQYNREQKRLLRRQGALDADGAPVARTAERTTRPTPPTGQGRSGFHPREYIDEVILEMRKVMKPKRPELINYATVVFFTLAFLMSLVYGLDYVYSLASSQLFK